MRPLLLLTVLIAAMAIGAPGVITRYLAEHRVASSMEGAAATLATQGPRTPGQAPRGSAGSSRLEVRAESDGHFYVEAEVNGRRVRLMVDTGATVVALRQTDAEAAGIRLNRADFDHPINTANGVARAAETQLDSVSVREIEVDDVRALVLPDKLLSVSLLGASFLNRLARYEASDGVLIFEN